MTSPQNLSNQPLILITGSTGYVGGRLLKVLEEEGYRIRCLIRKSARIYQQTLPATELIEGDALNKDDMMKALKGVDTAFYLIHSMASDQSFLELDRKAAMNFGEAASENGVRRIIYLGGLGRINDELSDHLKSRHEVGDFLRSSAKGVQVIELKASVVIGAGSLSFEMIRALCERLPFMITPKWVYTKLQPIAIGDLLKFLKESISIPLEGNKTFEIGGADQVSYAQLMKEYGKIRGLKRIMLPVPVLTPRLSSLWLGLVTPLYARVGRKLVDSASCPTIVTDTESLKVFNIKTMGCAEAIAEAIKNEDKECRQPRWIDSFAEVPTAPEWGGTRFGNRLIDVQTMQAAVSPEEAFVPIRRIGGATGYYYGEWLWSLRGLLDLMVGGVGMRRGRRDPENLQVGEVLDFWRVEAFEPNKRLLLRAEMKVPGRAWLEFKVEGENDRSTIRQSAIFDPIGVLGLFYWYAVYPLHRFVFVGMIRGIVAAALKDKHSMVLLAENGRFKKKSMMPDSASNVFSWHTREGAFERLLPPWEKVEVVRRTGNIAEGTVYLKISLGIIKISAIMKHYGFITDTCFNDCQIKGPFKLWDHHHIVEPVNPDKSYLTDDIRFDLPGGRIGNFIGQPFVFSKLKRTFKYRHELTYQDIGLHRKYSQKAWKILLVAGKETILYSQLKAFLMTGGHSVSTVDIKSCTSLEGFDAVILLPYGKLEKSELDELKEFSNALITLQHPPKVVIWGSSIQFYGKESGEVITDSSTKGSGVLSDECESWEAAAQLVDAAGIRTVVLRLGQLIDEREGSFAKFLSPYKFGLGIYYGKGDRMMNWITIDEALGIILHVMTQESARGAINAVTPNPITNKGLVRAIGRVLGRPIMFSLPFFLSKMINGKEEDIQETDLKIVPDYLLKTSYPFIYPTIEEAIGHLLGK